MFAGAARGVVVETSVAWDSLRFDGSKAKAIRALRILSERSSTAPLLCKPLRSMLHLAIA